MFRSRALLLSAAAFITLASGLQAASVYVQTNLVSDIPSLAAFTDSNLKNPWGMSYTATSPFWISNQATGTSTLYTGTGSPQSLVVTVGPGGTPSGPTGQVSNATSTFIENDAAKASFIFDTLAGTIDAWNSGDGTTAEVMHTTPGAVYTGLAMNSTNLFAANFAAGTINSFNTSFAAATLPGSFIDPNLPFGYSPYNVALINNLLYVEYDSVNSTTHQPQAGAGLGLVDVFDTSGNFLQRLITGSALNAPWGVTLAPAGWGSFGGDLLVGNFGNGEINAFNPSTGAFIGTVSGANGNPLVNSGLWAIGFRTGGTGVDANALYFTAGINNQADGLFGAIDPAPEPQSLVLLAIGAALIGAVTIVRRRV